MGSFAYYSRQFMLPSYQKAQPIVNPSETPMVGRSPDTLDELSQLIHSPGSLNTLTLTQYIRISSETHKY